MNDTLTRHEIEEKLSCGMAQILSLNNYEHFMTTLKSFSDEELYQVLAEAMQYQDTNTVSLKNMIKTAKEIRDMTGVNRNNTAMRKMPVEFLDENENAELLKRISQSTPSDIIKLTRESDSKLIRLWEDTAKTSADGEICIPSDLFFAETIPLMDLKISVDERMCENGLLVEYRVVVFNDYAENIRKATEDEAIQVGAVIMNYGKAADTSLIIPFYAVRGVDVLVGGLYGYRNVSPQLKTHLSKNLSKQFFAQTFVSNLETWYGIQIALLHPVVKDVFKMSKSIVDPDSKQKGTCHRKRRVKYIKQHVINTGDLEKAIFGENKEFTRRALVWYVIGHWRTYSDGRKVFVKPYWKGALKELKRNLDDREREIAQVCGSQKGELECAN